jgi:hypothetical protein
MLPCVALAALAVGVFVLHCLDTQQTGRALFVFLFFLVGGFLAAVALFGLAQLALLTTSSADSLHVNQQAPIGSGCGLSPFCSPSCGRGAWPSCNGPLSGPRNRNSAGNG